MQGGGDVHAGHEIAVHIAEARSGGDNGGIADAAQMQLLRTVSGAYGPQRHREGPRDVLVQDGGAEGDALPHVPRPADKVQPGAVQVLVTAAHGGKQFWTRHDAVIAAGPAVIGVVVDRPGVRPGLRIGEGLRVEDQLIQTVGLRAREEHLQRVRAQQVVAVQQHKILAAGCADEGVAGGAQAAVFLAQEGDAVIPFRVVRKNGLAAVGAAVVDAHGLNLPKALPQHAVQAGGQEVPDVVHGNQHGHQRGRDLRLLHDGFPARGGPLLLHLLPQGPGDVQQAAHAAEVLRLAVPALLVAQQLRAVVTQAAQLPVGGQQ